METGDGLLVRLSPLTGGLSPIQLIGLCDAANRCGNGIVEVTARGSLQVRGLSDASAPLFATEVEALAIAVRPPPAIDVGPLAGLDPDETADPRPLAAALRRQIAARALGPRLAPKTAIVVDGGGFCSLDALKADVRLRAIRRDGAVVWATTIGGDDSRERSIGTFGEPDALAAAIAVLEAMAALGPRARGRDLDPADLQQSWASTPPSFLPHISAVEGEMCGRTEGGVGKRPPCQRKTVPLRDGRFALSVALPFGTADAKTLTRLVSAAADAGVRDIRPSPGRTFLFLCPDDRAAESLAGLAASLDFSTDPADPRRRIVACVGAPGCASATIETRKLAILAAGALTPLLADPDFTVHVSGCAKGCAHPAPAALALVGGENSVGLVVNGTARHQPLAYRAPDTLPNALAGLVGLVKAARRSDEAARGTLARLPPARLAAAFRQER